MEPMNLKAKIVRSPHRSTVFQLQFDITPLMDENMQPMVVGKELEDMLVEWCWRGVLNALKEGRRKVPNHP